MAENLKTTQVISTTQAEVTRANTAFAEVDSLKTTNVNLQVSLNQASASNLTLQATNQQLSTQVATLQARVRELEAVVVPPVVVPPVVVPPVVVPPVTGRKGLYVNNGKLYTKNGTEFVIRGIESMCGSDSFNTGPTNWCKMQKDFGANTISPLWQSSQISVARLTTWLDAARAQGLAVGFNADHVTDGRAWLCRQDIVAVCNKYDNIFLECEVETGAEPSAQVWIDDVNGMVKAFRDAGHIHPIKVGSPQGGRLPRLAVENGQKVVDADPLKNVMFTWQAYWHRVAPTGRWHYPQDARIPVSSADPGGAIEQCKRIANSGLCFLIGIDKQDDVGTTCYLDVAKESDRLSIGWQHWCLSGDHIQPNNILSGWDNLPTSITDTGREISTLLKIKSKLAAL